MTNAANLITKTYAVGNYVSASFFEQVVDSQESAPSLDVEAYKIRQKADELAAQVFAHNKPAAISFDSARLQLVVSHTPEGHRALDDLFETLELPMQESLTFSRYEMTDELLSALKDSSVWKGFESMRDQLEEGGWIGIPRGQLVSWFNELSKVSPEVKELSQPAPFVLIAGVPYQFDAGEIRVVLTARIDPASQKPQLRIDYVDLAGRPLGARMINDPDNSAVWIPPVTTLAFLVFERNQDEALSEEEPLSSRQLRISTPLKAGERALGVEQFEKPDVTALPSEASGDVSE